MATAQVAIESIAAGGDGVGRTDGMVVFVPRSAPGDILSVRLTGKKRFARGTIGRIDTPSPDRIDPPCDHYVRERCGGCQLQHVTYPAQLRAKSTIIRDGIVRIGRRATDPPIVEASPRAWRYRGKLTLAMRNLPRGWVIGLHPYDDPAAVFQLADCPITDERVVAVWQAIFANTALLPPNADRGSVRIMESGGAAVVIEGGDDWTEGPRLIDAIPAIDALWWKPKHEARRVVASRAGIDLAGASFAQVNEAMATSLRAHVLDRVRRHAPATAVDAYAGSGSTAIPLANGGIAVTAIEMDRYAAEACATRLPAGSRSLTGRVEELLPTVLPADVVVLNPPRTGLADAIPPQLEGAEPRPRAIVYVSCNPATLGRDLARLPGYRIESVRGFDMFPQTAHVETVCELVAEAL